MSKSWPVEEFNAYLRALMDKQGIKDYAELHRLTGVSQNQFSNWRRGLAQPSRELLKRIAPALGLNSAGMLYMAAGHDEHHDLGVEERPDFTVLPRQIQDLFELYVELDAHGHGDDVLRSVGVLVAGLRAEFKDRTQRQPSGQRRRAG